MAASMNPAGAVVPAALLMLVGAAFDARAQPAAEPEAPPEATQEAPREPDAPPPEATEPSPEADKPVDPVKQQAKSLADRLFAEAHEALDRGDWGEACRKFRESMRHDISVSTQLNIARCLEHEGKLVEAWNDYNRARVLNRETSDPARREALASYMDAAIAKVEARLPKLRVVIDNPPPKLSIFRDGAPLAQGASGDPFPVNPGTHTLSISAPGYVTVTRTVTLSEGESQELSITLQPSEAPIVRPDTPPGEPVPAAIPTWVWPVGAIGLASLGAGIGLAVLSASARSELADGCVKQGGTFDCPDDRFTADQIDGLVLEANGGLAGAVALGAVGVAGIAAAIGGIAANRAAGDELGARVVPLLGPRSAGALLHVRF